MKLHIDGGTAIKEKNKLWHGIGMVSGNNTSQLLVDYKELHPKEYSEILRLLFAKEYLGICHLKIEMGADINSSSGTEPAIMRTENEEPDLTRGAGFMLAHDAKEINPDITLDMLWWSEPHWVSFAEDKYAARYKWYKKNLTAAYESLGLKFDCVSANQNEKEIDKEWIKYLSSRLKSEKDCPYDFSKIRIVAADEVTAWRIADDMLADRDLLDSVDIIGGHYTSVASKSALALCEKYGKEIWFSEGCSPMRYAPACRFDEDNSGLGGKNGMLDIANRIISMFPYGDMTMYEVQPTVAAYYDGANYCCKQFITANEPWSGFYSVDSGFYAALHFTQFYKRGWRLIGSACMADGKDNEHSVLGSTYSCLTAASPDGENYSFTAANTTDGEISYEIEASGLQSAKKPVYVWQTKGPAVGEAYDKNYFQKTAKIIPKQNGDKYTYTISIPKNALVTVSTLDLQKPAVTEFEGERTVLALPYKEDFSYSEKHLAGRGHTAKYFTDQSGAFEVRQAHGKACLMQLITRENKPLEWNGFFGCAATTFGDDRWFNYSISADVFLSSESGDDFAAIGLRYSLASNLVSGYMLKIMAGNKWQLCRGDTVLESGTLDKSFENKWVRLKLSVNENVIEAYIDGVRAAAYVSDNEAVSASGRAALASSYSESCFANVVLEPLGNPYIARLDDSDTAFEYSGDWEHDVMSSFKNWRRTLSTGEKGAGFTLKFDGTAVHITGVCENGARLEYTLDGESYSHNVPPCQNHEILLAKSGLASTAHTLTVKITDGKIAVDSAEINR